jgi:hypothetical protein
LLASTRQPPADFMGVVEIILRENVFRMKHPSKFTGIRLNLRVGPNERF